MTAAGVRGGSPGNGAIAQARLAGLHSRSLDTVSFRLADPGRAPGPYPNIILVTQQHRSGGR